jgi:hypothetical protein
MHERRLPRGLPLTAQNRRGGLGAVALAFLVLGAPHAEACSWWFWGDVECRRAPRAHGYRSPPPAYRYGSPAWAYGDVYAGVPSTALPQSRWYLMTAPQVPEANTVGLTIPITSAQGLMQGGMPARGPSLFGPNPPPAPPASIYYSGYYYSSPSSRRYYRAPWSNAPPPETPSWWLEPRRRR